MCGKSVSVGVYVSVGCRNVDSVLGGSQFSGLAVGSLFGCVDVCWKGSCMSCKAGCFEVLEVVHTDSICSSKFYST